MRQYLSEIKTILETGIKRNDRTGTGTISIFGHRMEFDLSHNQFPLLTTKKMFIRGIIEELLWFIGGDPDIKILQDKNVHIWDPWQSKDKYVPYPVMWKTQVDSAIELIKNDPESRRIIVDCWDPDELKNMVLPPCHCFFQFYVREDYLDMQLMVRSNDVFLGQPFNIAQYALLIMMVAQVTNKKPGKLIYVTGDTHIYLNHISQAKELLKREPRPLPKMLIKPGHTSIHDFTISDFKLVGYDPWPELKGEVSV